MSVPPGLPQLSMHESPRRAQLVLLGFALCLAPAWLQAQAPASDSSPVPPLFRSETPLAITLKVNMKQLRDDRGQESPYRPATISYTGPDGKAVSVPLRVKTHGIWRLKHCDFPPLRLNIANKQAKGTLFHDLQKPKLINVCRNSERSEQNVLQEMQLYRIYQVLTPKSHRVRTLRISYEDSASGKVEATRYAFLIEDPDELADRLGGKMHKVKGAVSGDLEPELASLVYVFQYFIANTDFSFNGLHNGELVERPDGSPMWPVAYDFDFSGAVNAQYATADASLGIKKVRQRLFRGYCSLRDDYPAAFARLREKRDAIYALYHDSVGKLLEPDVVKETLEYFDEFFNDTKTPQDIEHNVLRACVGRS